MPKVVAVRWMKAPALFGMSSRGYEGRYVGINIWLATHLQGSIVSKASARYHARSVSNAYAHAHTHRKLVKLVPWLQMHLMSLFKGCGCLLNSGKPDTRIIQT